MPPLAVIWQLRRRGYLGKTVVVNMQDDGTQRIELSELFGIQYVCWLFGSRSVWVLGSDPDLA